MKNQDKRNHERDIERLYKALERLDKGLGGKRLMSECHGKLAWPQSGIYLFFEDDEKRKNKEKEKERRIVRVGTHGVGVKKSKRERSLWERLRDHRGSKKTGGGNLSGSVFRKHVGYAISAKDSHAEVAIRKTQKNLEKEVSKYIGAMSILWLAIEDKAGPDSDRAYIECNLIGLLGMSGPLDPPSENWLGQSSPNKKIRRSGLWNVECVDYEYSPDFIKVLEKYVLITIGKKPKPDGSIAPNGWRTEKC